jgi:hypothetical protein
LNCLTRRKGSVRRSNRLVYHTVDDPSPLHDTGWSSLRSVDHGWLFRPQPSVEFTMPQEQYKVPVYFITESLVRRARKHPSDTAIATGNSAAWRCVCRKWLIGKTRSGKEVTHRSRVQCACGRNYEVVPKAPGQNARVNRVQEFGCIISLADLK